MSAYILSYLSKCGRASLEFALRSEGNRHQDEHFTLRTMGQKGSNNLSFRENRSKIHRSCLSIHISIRHHLRMGLVFIRVGRSVPVQSGPVGGLCTYA